MTDMNELHSLTKILDPIIETPQLLRENTLLKEEVARLKAREIELGKQIYLACANNNIRNKELSALHYVFCDGGCPGGVHRYDNKELDEETVNLAVRNTVRLISWFQNNHYKKNKVSLIWNWSRDRKQVVDYYKLNLLKREVRWLRDRYWGTRETYWWFKPLSKENTILGHIRKIIRPMVLWFISRPNR